jgi:hypothetical protein
LDVKATLCNKPWQVFNDSGEKELYIFQEDGTLLITYSGRVTHSTWQYIAANKSIVISAGQQSYMVHPAFMDNVLFALQVDGTNECAFLIDENNAQSFAPRSYTALMGYFEEKERRALEEERRKRQAAIDAENRRRQAVEDSDLHLESWAYGLYIANVYWDIKYYYLLLILLYVFLVFFYPDKDAVLGLSFLVTICWMVIGYIFSFIIERYRIKKYIKRHPLNKKEAIQLVLYYNDTCSFDWERIDLKKLLN